MRDKLPVGSYRRSLVREQLDLSVLRTANPIVVSSSRRVCQFKGTEAYRSYIFQYTFFLWWSGGLQQLTSRRYRACWSAS
jgi:hypothetical protein